ncbi:helix-turn-helix transcriptional regulator [Stenotrophomonas maltophilia]|nr:helix-turn-helix transcriptional regulator [Stenotrophomonas maltophilia]ELN2594762.1 helix-turn-helix transcriptional regulator [Stenotrophomonas maltophilia]MBH1400282.1 helix-turn-helix transcriptional regulator [Stenotrophomonas maltophilia]
MFAQRLKEARAMRGVSQRALGAKIGMTKQAGSTRINRYEQQTSRADMDTAAAMAKALGVPLAFLFAEDDDLAEAILAFSKLPADQRARILDHMKSLAAQTME